MKTESALLAIILMGSLLTGCGPVPVPTPTPTPPETPATPEASRPLNDTGLVTCGDYTTNPDGHFHSNTIDCAAAGAGASVSGVDGDGDPVPSGQDAVFGRDATNNDNSNGHAGFHFTKLDANGLALADQTKAWNAAGSEGAYTKWSCVKDEVTGLIWEIKAESGLRLKTSTYTWYNTDATKNGGNSGVANGGICSGASGCDTQGYITDVNLANLCGETSNNWRMPTYEELLSIVNFNLGTPAVERDYFPTVLGSYYWTTKTSGGYSVDGYSFAVSFNNGGMAGDSNSTGYYFMLVRSAN